MRVKVFDCNHEKELETKINEFISTSKCDIIDIKYQVSIALFGEDQLYCFSALIMYESK